MQHAVAAITTMAAAAAAAAAATATTTTTTTTTTPSATAEKISQIFGTFLRRHSYRIVATLKELAVLILVTA